MIDKEKVVFWVPLPKKLVWIGERLNGDIEIL